MRLDYIDPFVESTTYVLSEIAHLEIRGGTPLLKQSPMPTKDNVAIIGIAGDVEGRIIFEMDDKTALAFAGIMNNTRFEQLTPLAIDSLSELANMMIGNAVSRLNDMGFNFAITPPTFIKGKELFSSTPQVEALVVPLDTGYGEVILNIAIKYNTTPSGATIDMLLRGLEDARKAT
jgi:chemotaxis protein CheX